MQDLLDFLHSVHSLSPELENHLQTVVRLREVPRKEFLLKEGQVSREIYFIKRGLLRCYYLKEDIEVSTWFMKEGDTVVSIQSFYDQVPGSEYIQALEDSEVYYIRFEELEHLYRAFPSFNAIGRVLTIRYLKQWADQLYGIRMLSAEERYELLLSREPDLLLRVPQKYIASYLGMKESTLRAIRMRR